MERHGIEAHSSAAPQTQKQNQTEIKIPSAADRWIQAKEYIVAHRLAVNVRGPKVASERVVKEADILRAKWSVEAEQIPHLVGTPHSLDDLIIAAPLEHELHDFLIVGHTASFYSKQQHRRATAPYRTGNPAAVPTTRNEGYHTRGLEVPTRATRQPWAVAGHHPS